ncbi:branched-chain amino acid ABC transporter permease [Spirochaeta thermophila]|uniref:Transporter n=1 Tax=Winmispira thermophila (strain ATCC 49972 / DSM 6192 / RI 19.B1) TaxID=665571 RepID=E0RPY7_WINT6|nr:branched-chain amino acid ABC transporter permease [Spirochaeta thermophila]ADN02840.1 transporter [Spirochaeta thermophila DSM 6192]
MRKEYRDGLVLAGLSIVVVAAVTALVRSGLTTLYTAQVITLSGINVIVALGLNLITGFTGQLAIGHAGFMAVGAYTSALTMMLLGFPPVLGVISGGLLAAVVGMLIGFPTFRLRGDYLAIVTLAFGEVIRVIIINLPSLTGGAAGLKGVPPFAEGRMLKQIVAMDVVLVFMFLVIALMYTVVRSSYGRALIAIRDDEIAAHTMGIDVFGYKMFSFTLSAFIAGLGGGLYAPFFGYLTPQTFTFLKSVEILIIVVFGGMGSITGTVVAGFLLTSLQEFLRFLKDYRMVIYPLILIVMMLFRPQGLFGEREISISSLFRKAGGKRASEEGDPT